MADSQTPVKDRQTLLKSFFLLPFQMVEGKSPDERTLSQMGSCWEPQHATRSSFLQNHRNLAEFLYFHPHVRRFLYDFKGDDQTATDSPTGAGKLLFFSYRATSKPGSWSLSFSSEGGSRTLVATLPGNGINLYRFFNGIYILSIECHSRLSVSDALDFNNLARRLYPVFGDPDIQMKNRELPGELTFSYDGIPGDVQRLSDWSGRVEQADDFIERDLFFTRRFHPAIHWLIRQACPDGKIHLPLDDRMLVLSRFGVQGAFPETDEGRKEHEVLTSRGMWVDASGDPGVKAYNPDFLEPLERELRNMRWSHLGGEQGFSRYSAFFLGYHRSLDCLHVTEDGHVENIDMSFLFDHHDTIHLKLFLMAVFYRCSLLELAARTGDLLKASREVVQLSATGRSDFVSKIKSHLADFVLFSNRYWFTELSNQDEGIEIFDKMRHALRLDELYLGLKEDIQRTDTLLDSLVAYDEMRNNAKERRFNRMFGHWGVYFGVSAVVTGFFGMNFFERDQLNQNLPWSTWPVLLFAVGLFWMVFLLLKRPWNVESESKQEARP